MSSYNFIHNLQIWYNLFTWNTTIHRAQFKLHQHNYFHDMLNWLLGNYQYTQYTNMEDVTRKTVLKNIYIKSSSDFHKWTQPSKMSHSQKSNRTINISVEAVFLSVCIISSLVSPGEKWCLSCDPYKYFHMYVWRRSIKYVQIFLCSHLNQYV